MKQTHHGAGMTIKPPTTSTSSIGRVARQVQGATAQALGICSGIGIRGPGPKVGPPPT